MCARILGCVVGLVVVLLPLHTPNANATQIMAMDIESLGRDAAVVVEATVLAKQAYWNEGRTRILTRVDLAIDRAHKGAPAGRLSVVQAGGEIDGMRMTVHGVTHWQVGERVLAFLEPAFDTQFRVTGFSQGKFSIRTDPQTGEEIAIRPELGVEAVDGEVRAMRVPLRRVLEQAQVSMREER